MKRTPFAKAEELLHALRPLEPRWQPYPGEWIFRGHADGNRYKLLPTAHRAEAWAPFAQPGEAPFDPLAGYQSDIVQAQKEYALLKPFMLALDQAGIGAPDELYIRRHFEAANENDLEFLLQPAVLTFAALAQHHRLPTRLLDWTRVGSHAAYFAAAGAAKRSHETGVLCVWALSTAFVERIQVLEEALLNHLPHLRTVTAPRSSNANLHAQAGLFTLCWNLAKIAPLDDVILIILQELAKDPETRWKSGPPLHRFDLPWSEAPTLLRFLSYEQIDGVRMYPGRDGVVRGMKERALWDQKE